MSGAIATLAVRGNSIYLFYVTQKNQGTLSALSAQPPFSSSSPTNTASPLPNSGPIIPASASSFSEQSYGQDGGNEGEKQVSAVDSAAIVPTVPGGSNLYLQPQSISPSAVAPRGGQFTSISMVSTSSLVPSTNTYRHDLLIACNGRGQLPLLLRLSPTFPNTGSGPQAGSSPQWSFDSNISPPLAPSLTTSYLSLATGSSGRMFDTDSEGSSVYQLVASGPSSVPQVLKFDVTNPSGPIMVPWAPGAVGIRPDLSNPVIVSLKGNSAFDTAVIGVSSSSQLMTAVQIDSESQQLSALLMVQGQFDDTACYTDGNGQIIKATQQTIQSLSVAGMSGSWIDRKTSSSSNNLPTPILACATIDSTLYAVLEGPSGPAIYTADISPSTEWIWRSRPLINIGGSNGGIGNGNGGSDGALPVDSSDRSSKGLSTGAMVGIIAVVLVVLGGALFWFLWRRRQSGAHSKAHALDKITVLPPLAPPPQPGVIGHQQHAYSPVFSENSATTTVMVPGHGQPARYMSSQSLGQQPVVSMSPQMNYHQPITSPPAPGWTTAVYPPSNSTRPGEHIPMVASSLSTAPPPPISTAMYGTSTSASIPSTPGYTHASPIFGDKQELTSEDTSFGMQPASSAIGTQQRASSASAATAGAASPTDTNNTLVPPGAARNDARVQEMFSPALANAQLILQRSQSPPNQMYQEIPQQHQQQPGFPTYHR
ncbi:hypothetical protein EC991_008110 [Linnemannia zychae]|nr:hypothetical protein EC991_008110 [Linnemannia zychae]